MQKLSEYLAGFPIAILPILPGRARDFYPDDDQQYVDEFDKLAKFLTAKMGNLVIQFLINPTGTYSVCTLQQKLDKNGHPFAEGSDAAGLDEHYAFTEDNEIRMVHMIVGASEVARLLAKLSEIVKVKGDLGGSPGGHSHPPVHVT